MTVSFQNKFNQFSAIVTSRIQWRQFIFVLVDISLSKKYIWLQNLAKEKMLINTVLTVTRHKLNALVRLAVDSYKKITVFSSNIWVSLARRIKPLIMNILSFLSFTLSFADEFVWYRLNNRWNLYHKIIRLNVLLWLFLVVRKKQLLSVFTYSLSFLSLLDAWIYHWACLSSKSIYLRQFIIQTNFDFFF